MVADAREPVEQFARDRIRRAPDRPVYSNLDAAPHPDEPSAITSRLGDHLASPVRFADMIAAMHRDGARVFVEVGPGAILGPLVESILDDRPHLTISCDVSSASGLAGFLMRLARLIVAGLPLRLERLTAGRSQRQLDLNRLPTHGLAEPATTSTWLVNGSRARPLAGAEPRRLGTGPVLSLPEFRPVLQPPPKVEPKTARPALRQAPTRRIGNGKPEPPMTTKTTTLTSQTSAHPDRVMESFQKTMQAFLDVQKATMLAYLNGQSSPSIGCSVGTNGHDVAGSVSTNGHDVDGAHAGWSMPASHPPNSKAFGELRPTSTDLQADEMPISRNGKPATLTPEPSTVEVVEIHAAETPDRATITAKLLEIVRDRTGYPTESLDLDLDIEADLGIDSIKRVEILGKLRDDSPGLRNLSDSAEVMDALARARTLGAIVDRMATLAGRSGVQPIPDTRISIDDRPSETSNTGAGANGNSRPGQGTSRRVLEAVDAPLPRERLGLMPGGRIVVTDDGKGVAERVAVRLESEGIPVERIGGPDRPVEWTSATAIDSVLEELRTAGTDRRDRACSAAGSGDLRRSEGILLVGTDRRRGEGAVLAGKGDSR